MKNAKLPQEAPRESKMEASKSPGRKISELLKEKEREWTDVVRKIGPLQLLDLPLELLTEILREVCFHASRDTCEEVTFSCFDML